MEIKTRFNIDDTVVFLFERNIKTGRISKIRNTSMKNSLNEVYTLTEYTVTFSVCGGPYHEVVREDHVFSSREELLNSL